MLFDLLGLAGFPECETCDRHVSMMLLGACGRQRSRRCAAAPHPRGGSVGGIAPREGYLLSGEVTVLPMLLR